MAANVYIRSFHAARCLALLVVALLAPASSASAQGNSAIGDAVLALWNGGTTNGIQTMNGRLFGGVVLAEVKKLDSDPKKLGPDDQVVRFEIGPPGRPPVLRFPTERLGTSRDAFTKWVKDNAGTLLNIVFPTSLSQSASGTDAASNNAQQFLGTALGISAATQAGRLRASEAGGLFESERFSGDGRSGFGFQGIYKMGGHVSLLGRFARQDENETPINSVPVKPTSTTSINAAVDYRPSVLVNEDLDWRLGVDARAGLLFARATTLDFGSLDFGAGAWTSGRKDFSRLRVGFGSLVGATKSYLPTKFLPASDEVQSLAEAFNKRNILWDVSYGTVVGFALAPKTTLNAKVLQTRPLESGIIGRPTLTTVMGGVSYLVGGLTPIDVGYKHTSAGGITSHSIFLQGNFSF